jgi:hypothetical protein
MLSSAYLMRTAPQFLGGSLTPRGDERGWLCSPQVNSAVPTYTNELLDSTITWAGIVADTMAHTSRHEVMASEFNVSAINVPLKRSYSYGDSLDHITQMSLSHGTDGELRQYTYTLAGELAGEQVDSLTSGVSCPPPLGQHLYDDGYSCTPLSGFVANHEFCFKYDSAGNRTESRDSVLGTDAIDATSPTQGMESCQSAKFKGPDLPPIL